MEAVLDKLILFSFLNSHDLDESLKLVREAYNKYAEELPEDEHSSLIKLSTHILYRLKSNDQLALKDFKKNIDKLVPNNANSVNFLSWYEFYKESKASERVAFLLSQFLKLNDDEVAQVLNISTGSVRYRVSESYQKLSKVIKYA